MQYLIQRTRIVLVLVACSLPAAAADLRVIIQPLESRTGMVTATLIDDPDQFPMAETQIYTQQIRADYAAKGDPIMLIFTGLKPGDYAVSVYQDTNDNGKLDTNFIGIPSEPVGASNNPAASFGPPSFADASISIGEDDVTTEITLNN